jgi:hypothetical protein
VKLSKAGVPFEANRFFSLAESHAQEFFQLAELTVAQRVHGVDDNGLNTVSLSISQNVVDDRDDVGEAFAGPGPRGQDVVLLASRNVDCVSLMLVQTHRSARRVVLRLNPEDTSAVLV